MGTGPQVPWLPFMILPASMSTASFWLANFLATSLYAGPTTFLSTEWQAMQFLDLARASSAIAGAETIAVMARANRVRFIVVVPLLGYIAARMIVMTPNGVMGNPTFIIEEHHVHTCSWHPSRASEVPRN